jgi:hypothetical protein
VRLDKTNFLLQFTSVLFRYDTEAECEALEKEKLARELVLAQKERKYV